MTPSTRAATAGDVAACIDVRGLTRENAIPAARLAELGITAASWSSDVRSGALVGHVGEVAGRVVGHCFGATRTGEVVVLAVLPEYEARGLGKTLLRVTMAALRAHGHERLTLGCSSNPRHRSYGFYRHLGWRPAGGCDVRGDELLEYHFCTRPRTRPR